uniref:Uncharacterized protein n=1 Tax=Panagrellus redivivus TaxID=6233 RepID=A0A7E4W3F2_PANRE
MTELNFNRKSVILTKLLRPVLKLFMANPWTYSDAMEDIYSANKELFEILCDHTDRPSRKAETAEHVKHVISYNLESS